MEQQAQKLGDFRICGVLGEGGGGIVYAAEGPIGDIALKVPHPDRELTERDRQRYLAEAAMMARVEHPAIVEILGSGVLPDGRPYVAMPQLAGKTLAERVVDDGPFAVSHALRLIEQLGAATGALHRADLLHRDLKVENVFLTEGEEAVKLLDFGIAKDRRSTTTFRTTTGMVRGTPATMAPERFFGTEATERSDIYELAVVFYVMVVGQLPWAGKETDINARSHPRPPHVARSTIPVAVSDVVMTALATDPLLRPDSPAELVAALWQAYEQPQPTYTSQATVTSDNLRQLIAYAPTVDSMPPVEGPALSGEQVQFDNRTPFDAAAPSKPHGAEPAAPRQRLWMAVAAAAALGVLGWSQVDTAPRASAATGLVSVSAEIAERAATEATASMPVEDPVTEAQPEEAPAADAEPDAAKTRPAAKVTPAKAKPRAVPKAKKAAPPTTEAPPAKESDAIAGGVHGSSPY